MGPLPIASLRTSLVSVSTARLGFERPLGNAAKSPGHGLCFHLDVLKAAVT